MRSSKASPKQQWRPLPPLLSLSFFYDWWEWVQRHLYNVQQISVKIGESFFVVWYQPAQVCSCVCVWGLDPLSLFSIPGKSCNPFPVLAILWIKAVMWGPGYKCPMPMDHSQIKTATVILCPTISTHPQPYILNYSTCTVIKPATNIRNKRDSADKEQKWVTRNPHTRFKFSYQLL